MMGVLYREDKAFPQSVRRALPKVKALYFEGDPKILEQRSIGVVGSRKCTRYGEIVASSIGRRAGEEGVALVSGLAKGIDTAGHKGSLEVKGKTIAVLGGGTDYYYPAENKRLQQKIGTDGLLLSLHPPGYRPQPFDFPIRNQVISALSESIVVVEAGRKSGSLITAEYGADQGKRIYAVPGNITSYYSFGTNQLIREGAEPLIVIDDVFTDMGISLSGADQEIEMLSESEKRVYLAVKDRGQTTVDEIYHKTNMKLSEINGIITILEIKGLIFSSLGKIFVAKF